MLWPIAGLAQLGEQLICNHQVVSSSPTAGTDLISQECNASSSASNTDSCIISDKVG